MRELPFNGKFERILEPALKDSGFTRIKLKNCICPEYLYYKRRLWFALSWDWRDRYLEACLGHLHWFSDVMERVVVIGDYSCYDSRISPDAIDRIGDESKVLTIVASSLEEAISIYENEYDRIFENFRITRSKRSGININEYIGNEVTLGDLKSYEI